MKIVTVLGARPQFIKAGTVSRAIQEKISKGCDLQEIIVHTGQHYDSNMSDVFFDELGIPKPHYFLNVNGSSHGKMTAAMVEKIEEVLINEGPDWVLVYGDTNSTLAAALAASKLGVKIAHIEAGLRSFNMNMPEEINRIVTDRLSTLLFCPTNQAVTNLEHEGLDNWRSGARMSFSGDVMFDGALYYSQFSQAPVLDIELRNFVLCTIHRAENTNSENRLREIVNALKYLSTDRTVILPLHPRTKKIAEDLGISFDGINVIEPQGYLSMIWLIRNCDYVVTDSGGLQKEAFFFKKYCVTLRDETEWIELVEHGLNTLAGADTQRIIESTRIAETGEFDFSVNLYGDGSAAVDIVNTLIDFRNV